MRARSGPVFLPLRRAAHTTLVSTPFVKTLLLVLLVLALAVVALLIAKRLGLLRTGAPSVWPFYVKRPLTQPEQVLYHRLVKALPEHIVLAQVQVSRVLGIKKGANVHEWNNRINRLSYDFVVCTMDSTVIAAIELDDSTHGRSSRTRTDDKKNKATADAGLKMIRWHVRSLPDESAIRQALIPQPTPVTSNEGAASDSSSERAT